MWSIGCIFFEIVTRTPLFPGDSEVEQLTKIYSLLGTPTESMWPDAAKLPNYIAFEPLESLIPPTPVSSVPVEENIELQDYIRSTYNSGTSLGKLFKNYQPPQNIYFIMFVIMSCLQLNPLHRCSAKNALEARYFTADPPPTVPYMLKLPFIATAPPVGADSSGSGSENEDPPPPVFSSDEDDMVTMEPIAISKKRKHDE